MTKIKIWILAALCLFLSGCTRQEGEAVQKSFSLSEAQEQTLRTAIEDTMNALYWRYDDDSVIFTEQVVPQRTDENAAGLFAASEKSGYELKKYAGKIAVVATADMIHLNGDQAGIAYFYFYREKLIGLYYTVKGNAGKYYAMESRNVYQGDVAFSQYETEKAMAEFTSSRSKFPESGFCSLGKTAGGDVVAAVLEQDRILIYRYRNGFSLYRTLRFSGKVPISATFYEDAAAAGHSLAVIFGTEVIEGEGEGESHFVISEVLRCYNQNFVPIGDIELTSTGYSCVAADGDTLLLMNDTILESFIKQEDNFIKDKQYFLGHGAVAMMRTDLDGDGIAEYLMTDGMDFYLYRQEEIHFSCLWKTHLGIENFRKAIYVADLNQDGVKELYLVDATGTSIRYILKEAGLESRNEDIKYGERYFGGDFNGDGKDDYIFIGDIENTRQELYLAK